MGWREVEICDFCDFLGYMLHFKRMNPREGARQLLKLYFITEDMTLINCGYLSVIWCANFC